MNISDNKFYFHVEQEYVNDCAAACVATYLANEEIEFDILDIRKKLHLTKDGAGIKDLFYFLESINVTPEIYEINIKEESVYDVEIDTPCICYMEQKAHYIYIHNQGKVNGGNCLVSDPIYSEVREESVVEIMKESKYIICLK